MHCQKDCGSRPGPTAVKADRLQLKARLMYLNISHVANSCSEMICKTAREGNKCLSEGSVNKYNLCCFELLLCQIKKVLS